MKIDYRNNSHSGMPMIIVKENGRNNNSCEDDNLPTIITVAEQTKT